MSNNGWRIDHSTGRPILVYQNCSVIEAEQAEYVLRLIQQDRNKGEPVKKEISSTTLREVASNWRYENHDGSIVMERDKDHARHWALKLAPDAIVEHHVFRSTLADDYGLTLIHAPLV